VSNAARPAPAGSSGTPLNPFLIPRLIIWPVVCGLLTVTVADPDLWGHVLFGADILRDGTIPRVDGYSFTSDRMWINHEWLAEVVMGTAFMYLGPTGLGLLKTLMLVAAFGLLIWDLRERLPMIGQDLLLVLLVIGCISLTRTFRPQTFSVLLFSGLLVCLRRADTGQSRLLWALPPLFALWANLHGGWLVGLGVLGLWVAVRLVQPVGPSRVVWAAAGLLSVAATGCTPYGVQLWQFLWETVGLGRADISEWQTLAVAPIFDWIPWTVAAIALTVAIARGRPPFVYALTSVVLMLLAFKVIRLVPFFVMAVAYLLGPHVARREAAPAAPTPPPKRAELAFVVALALTSVIAGGVTSVRNLACISSAESWVGDRAARTFIEQRGWSGRMLTWFDWGEYAIWHLHPAFQVSMDGRRETVYSQTLIDQHLAVYFARPGWESILESLAPDVVWLPAEAPVVSELERAGWQPVLATPRSRLFTRDADRIAAAYNSDPSLDNAAPPESAAPQCFPE
jgi:hypothetical protein